MDSEFTLADPAPVTVAHPLSAGDPPAVGGDISLASPDPVTVVPVTVLSAHQPSGSAHQSNGAVQLMDPAPITVGAQAVAARPQGQGARGSEITLADPGPVTVGAQAIAARPHGQDAPAAEITFADPSPVTVVSQTLGGDQDETTSQAIARLLAPESCQFRLADLGLTLSPSASATHTAEELFAMVRPIAAAHSGGAAYAYVTPSTEGDVRVGLGQASLTTGDLGAVLTMAHTRDPAAFDAAFGTHAAELLRTTTAANRYERLVPVGGEPLTSPQWQTRFADAGTQPFMQYAQNEHLVEHVARPVVAICEGLGSSSATCEESLATALNEGVVCALASLLAPFQPDIDFVAFEG